MSKFIHLDNTDEGLYTLIQNHDNIVLVKPVQSGKTGEVLRLIEEVYKSHLVIFLSDKNTALSGQTNKRSKTLGWTVGDFRDINSPIEAYDFLMKFKGPGRKRVAHFLMEVNNIKALFMLLACFKDTPVILVVDEGDKNKNVIKDDSNDDSFDEDSEVELPPITRGILACKNLLKSRSNGSKTMFVTATPISILVSEKDENRLVVYKAPFNNYIGAGLGHTPDVELVNSILHNNCKTRDRWTGNREDVYTNSYRSGVLQAIHKFEELGSKDTSIKQIMLVSLENRNINQTCLSMFIRENLSQQDINIIAFNGENKSKESPLLSDRIKDCKSNKVIIVAGFMASRGVSFTDFSDCDNKFELVIQVHAAKKGDPLNSALQAMRIYGPARRTVVRPFLFCNSVTWRDNKYNFVESYRVAKDLAEGNREVQLGNFDSSRPMCQAHSFRYMKQGRYGALLFESHDVKDHEPITTLS